LNSIQLFPEIKMDRKLSCWESKMINYAYPYDHFPIFVPVHVAKKTSG